MANPSVVPPARTAQVRFAPPSELGHQAGSSVPAVLPTGPRKLVRPPVSNAGTRRSVGRREESVLSAHKSLTDHAIAAAGHDSSHAESFYFQKQVQTQTLMCFVLDNDEKVEGYIEWYDRNSIKVRNSGRVLIYKSSIKYLYKAGENSR